MPWTRNVLNLFVGLALVGALAVGCAPRINGFDPDPGTRMAMLTVQGDGLGTAALDIDGNMVGSWIDLVRGGRTTIVPTGVVPSAASVRACNAAGCSSSAALALNAANPTMAVSVNVVSGPNAQNCTFLGSPAQCVTIAGTGIYPGTAGVAHPSAGPTAKAVVAATGTGPGAAALGTTMVTENTLLVFFPRTLGPGPFHVSITNLPAYGGGAGQTANTFVP
jgi:hypothetical protein